MKVNLECEPQRKNMTKHAHTTRLIACPFCGHSKDLETDQIEDDPETWGIYCNNCKGNKGALVTLYFEGTRQDAINHWNHRKKVWG